MARNTTVINASPDRVWELLEDPYAYPKWVVGSDRTLGTEGVWPAPGSSFRVRLVGGPKDRTTVREVDPARRRIVLDAASSYLGPARVTLKLRPEGPGTHVTMVEDPAGKAAPLRWLPVVQLLIKLRNVEGLRRLRRLAERHASPATS